MIMNVKCVLITAKQALVYTTFNEYIKAQRS